MDVGTVHMVYSIVNLPSHHDHSSSHMSCICTVMAFHGHKGTTALLSGGSRHTDLVLWQNRFHSSWQRGLGHLHLKEFTLVAEPAEGLAYLGHGPICRWRPSTSLVVVL